MAFDLNEDPPYLDKGAYYWYVVLALDLFLIDCVYGTLDI
jgi:hypothetical protein